MKDKLALWILAGAIAIMPGLTGCLEQKVKTTVSQDGACARSISVTADSGRLPETKLPLPSGPGWTTQWVRQDTAGKKGFAWTASKTYANLAELAEDTTALFQPGKIRIAITGGSSFRWFYTYFHYRETYRRFTPLDRVPPTAVMTDEEIRRFALGEGGDTLRNKVERWKNLNVADFFLASLDTVLRDGAKGFVSPDVLRSHREDILARLLKENDINLSLSEYVPAVQMTDLVQDSSSLLTARGLESMRRLFVDALGTNTARDLPLQESWSRTVTFFLTATKGEASGDFENVVSLPGLFLDANAGALKGNTATWKFKPEQIELTDYAMYAESRVVNSWAFIVSGLLVLGLVLLMLVPKIRAARK